VGRNDKTKYEGVCLAREVHQRIYLILQLLVLLTLFALLLLLLARLMQAGYRAGFSVRSPVSREASRSISISRALCGDLLRVRGRVVRPLLLNLVAPTQVSRLADGRQHLLLLAVLAVAVDRVV
jgi:hypothetical protein